MYVFIENTKWSVPWLSRLIASLSIALRSVRVGFTVDNVALGQVFLRVFRFTFQNHSTVAPHTHIPSGGWINRPTGGRSSGTYSHLIFMNNTWTAVCHGSVTWPRHCSHSWNILTFSASPRGVSGINQRCDQRKLVLLWEDSSVWRSCLCCFVQEAKQKSNRRRPW
jgi:hypothetical protein